VAPWEIDWLERWKLDMMNLAQQCTKNNSGVLSGLDMAPFL